ncbi:hypothetical protein AVEN_53038-1 [Araneus ventricosus]|uniref:Uncharacterized protein n=1 Tax=Araneus ventricosus TaxID=182803 RepID=A0A4Y2MFY6_ARAVE|nr:hypothetical protein AVEN_53038-1 [Araneus ventricosus]
MSDESVSEYYDEDDEREKSDERDAHYCQAGADDVSVSSAPLTYLELFCRDKGRNKTIWLIPPVHHWYQGSRRGGCVSIDCSRRAKQLLLAYLVGISEV